MQSTDLNCNKDQGTVEITVSKREISVEKAKVVVDYKLRDIDEYEIQMFIGFTDSAIMKPYSKWIWKVPYNEVRGAIRDRVRRMLENHEEKDKLRKSLREYRGIDKLDADYTWKVVRFYPAEYEIGYTGIQVVMEYKVSNIGIATISVFISNKNGDRKLIKTVISNGCLDIMSKVDEIYKEQMIKGGELVNFISEHSEELDFTNNFN